MADGRATPYRAEARAIIELGLHLAGHPHAERAAAHLIAALRAGGYEIVKVQKDD